MVDVLLVHIDVHCKSTLPHSRQTLPRLRPSSFQKNLGVNDKAQQTILQSIIDEAGFFGFVALSGNGQFALKTKF